MKSKQFVIWLLAAILLLVTSSRVSLAAPPHQEPTPTPERQKQISPPPPELQALSGEALAKIEALVIEELTVADSTDYFIWMAEKADLRPTYQLQTKEEKGRFVFETTRATAERSQAALRQQLESQGVAYRPFYIANKVLVRAGNAALLADVATRPDVARISANHTFQLKEPIVDPNPPVHALAVESNLSFVDADQVWALGYDGAGAVLAGNDTGLDWSHPALINHYRGWDGANADHNYHWWDATGTYPSVPGDGHGHGTHTTGTMVGDDGGANHIGMAPGARTIHCKNLTDAGYGSDATITECFEWDLAPWDLNGANPRPDLAPDAVNNSWGYGGGNHPQFEDEIAALQAAGILVEASAGNDGPGCASLGSPGDYRQVLTTGSVSHASGVLPGTLTSFSSRGASDLYPADYLPDVMAPGQSIRSSLPGNSYASWSGTSMSGPHVTGLVGLMWSANPALRGQVEATTHIIQDTAVPLTGQTGSNCGGDYAQGPNNDWGHGTVDALAAVQQAILYGDTGMLAGVVTDAVLHTPMPDAIVQASFSPTITWQITTDVHGNYALQVISGTYTVDASSYGYLPAHVTNVSVVSGTTTTLNIALTPRAQHVVSGFVTDSGAGWPLYATISIDGYPGGPIWSDPVTGHYSVTLVEGITYTFNVTASNYTGQSRLIGPLTGDVTHDFALLQDFSYGCPPGYQETILFADGFESGGMGPSWSLFTTNQGRVQVSTAYPYSGSYSTLLDNAISGGSASTAAIILTQDLSGQDHVNLDFWWREFGDENHFEDGIFISDDLGANWHQVLSFNDGPSTFRNDMVDISAAAAVNGLTLNDHFQIKFQFYDDYSIPTDGYALDEVKLDSCTPLTSGRVVGTVYDANTGLPLTGAAVDPHSGPSVTTDVNGFYQLFAIPGTHTITGTMSGGYAPDVQIVTVIQNETIQQDFILPAGQLSYAPASLETTLGLGMSVNLPLTLTNSGGVAATFELQEIDRGCDVSAKHPAVEIPGYQVTGDPTSYAGQHLASHESRFYQPSQDALLGISTDVLLLAAADVTQIQAILQAYPDINLADYFDARLATPGLADLLAYDTVIVIANQAFANPVAVGDVLADYVDAGGTVIQTVPTFYDPFGVGWGLQGRFVTDGYSPFIGTGDWFLWADLGAFDPSHPIMHGVTSAGDRLRQVVTLNQDASLVAEWTDDEFIATKGSVVALNTFLADGYAWTGDVDLIVHNSIVWLNAGLDVPWLSVAPITGTIPSLANQAIAIAFDASVPEITQPVQCYAELRIKNDTPYDVYNVPIIMTVTRYGVELSPSLDAKSADPNATVTYTLQITNTGLNPDTFDVSVVGNKWTTTAPAQVGPLVAGSSVNLDVTVTVPAFAVGGATDTATIVVTSQSDNSQSAAALLTTTANGIYAVQVAPLTQAKSGDAGAIVTYTLHITNAGTITDTFRITASGYEWPPVVPLQAGPTAAEIQIGPLLPGASDAIDIAVVIPAVVPPGTSDIVTITVTSHGDDVKSAIATLVTSVQTSEPMTHKLFLPIIAK